MDHIVGDNAAEWDARVQREQQRKKKVAHRAHLGVSVGVLLGLVAVAVGLTSQSEKPPAVAGPQPARSKAVEPIHPAVPVDESFTFKPGSEQLEVQAQSLAVGLARIWQSGKSEDAAETARAYTGEYERVAGCDLRWVAGRAGPGVWEGTLGLARSLREITPYVGRAREGKAVVVTAITCPSEGEARRSTRAHQENQA